MSVVVYVASPYTKGSMVDNVRRQIAAGDWLLGLGYTPLLPLLTHFWDLISPHPYEDWLALDLVLVTRCDVLLRLPGASAGADREVAHARDLDIPVVEGDPSAEVALALIRAAA